MSTNTYERAEAVIENERLPEFFAHMACQLAAVSPSRAAELAWAPLLKKLLCDEGFIATLSRVERDYR